MRPNASCIRWWRHHRYINRARKTRSLKSEDRLLISICSLCRAKIVYGKEMWTVYAITRVYFGVYFPSCFVRVLFRYICINITMAFSWTHKQFTIPDHYSITVSYSMPTPSLKNIYICYLAKRLALSLFRITWSDSVNHFLFQYR